jgi:predicted O-methyltransferase YrrM
MSEPVVNVLCRNPNEDRIIPRLGRALRDGLGWPLTTAPLKSADAYYLSLYFEGGLLRGAAAGTKPAGAYFSHREEDAASAGKARVFDEMAARLALRVVTAAMYARMLAPCGPTVQVPPPVERERFTIPKVRNKILVAGFSGYTYGNGRKGEELARKLFARKRPPGGGSNVTWRASGRGWPVKTTRYLWAQMPAFYQSLDVLVVTALVEGVPMPALEALSCGVSLVAPRGVGLLDELPDTPGIHRYERGNAGDLARAFDEALALRPDVDREALRAVTEPYTAEAWCEGHRRAFAALLDGGGGLNGTLTGTDEEILDEVRQAYPEVGAVLGWTRKHIPHLKRQIAPYQGAVLAAYAHQQDRLGARFLEIGTAIGYSACLMATAAPRAQVTTLNPKDGEYEKARANLRIRSNVEVVKKTSQEFLRGLNGQSYDLIFVDGDHAYAMVQHDAQFFNALRPGGLILFHDYSPEGSARPSDGSYRALNELQARHRPADVLVVGTGQVGMLGWIRQGGEIWD